MTATLTLLAFGALARAGTDPAVEVWDLVANMAEALSEPNPAGFMKPIAKSFDHYELLDRQVRALVLANDVVSSISPLSNTGDDKQRVLELDWYMQIHSQGDGSKTTVRRQILQITLARTGKHWQVTSIKPIDLFAPPGY